MTAEAFYLFGAQYRNPRLLGGSTVRSLGKKLLSINYVVFTRIVSCSERSTETWAHD